MENNDEKQFKGLIAFTGLMSMGLASLIGQFVLINSLEALSITSVLLFIAGIVSTTISYLITVKGGVPLPGPKKRFVFFMALLIVSEIGLFLLVRGMHGPDINSVFYLIAGVVGTGISYFMAVSGGVLPPGPKGK